MGLSNKTVILRFPSHAACRADATGDCLPQTFTEFQQKKSCKKHSSYSYFPCRMAAFCYSYLAIPVNKFLFTCPLPNMVIWLFPTNSAPSYQLDRDRVRPH